MISNELESTNFSHITQPDPECPGPEWESPIRQPPTTIADRIFGLMIKRIFVVQGNLCLRTISKIEPPQTGSFVGVCQQKVKVIVRFKVFREKANGAVPHNLSRFVADGALLEQVLEAQAQVNGNGCGQLLGAKTKIEDHLNLLPGRPEEPLLPQNRGPIVSRK
ncbi:aspartate kinase [Anopheles sinensis]|uniref:Aspartate kinase n=1 Tax=Anopheles sinensis TaxID=74873 RepID=A0A084VY42_ANOSI|nr:aspartate kinase [Anopheles sinensis]